MTLAMKTKNETGKWQNFFHWPPAFWHHLSHLFLLAISFSLLINLCCCFFFIFIALKLNWIILVLLLLQISYSCIWKIIKDLRNIFILNLDFILNCLKDIMSQKPQKENFLIDILNSLVGSSIMSRLRWMRGTLVENTSKV